VLCSGDVLASVVASDITAGCGRAGMEVGAYSEGPLRPTANTRIGGWLNVASTTLLLGSVFRYMVTRLRAIFYPGCLFHYAEIS